MVEPTHLKNMLVKLDHLQRLQVKCFELLNCSFFLYLQALTKSSNPSAHGLSTQMIMVIPACSRSMMKGLRGRLEFVITCVSVSHPFSC